MSIWRSYPSQILFITVLAKVFHDSIGLWFYTYRNVSLNWCYELNNIFCKSYLNAARNDFFLKMSRMDRVERPSKSKFIIYEQLRVDRQSYCCFPSSWQKKSKMIKDKETPSVDGVGDCIRVCLLGGRLLLWCSWLIDHH